MYIYIYIYTHIKAEAAKWLFVGLGWDQAPEASPDTTCNIHILL